MIIYGIRTYVQTLAMLTLACRNGHTAAHRLGRRTRKFTLFFIPLFPVSRSYFTVCTMCGETLKLDRTQAEQLQAQAAGTPPAPAPANPVAPPLYPQTGMPAVPPPPPAAPPTADRPRPTPN